MIAYKNKVFFVNCAIYIVLFEKINFFKKIISKMPGLVGLVGLASKHAAFSRTGTVPVRFNNGTVLLISVSTYRASKSFFYFLFISEKYYMGTAFLIVPDWFTF